MVQCCANLLKITLTQVLLVVVKGRPRSIPLYHTWFTIAQLARLNADNVVGHIIIGNKLVIWCGSFVKRWLVSYRVDVVQLNVYSFFCLIVDVKWYQSTKNYQDETGVCFDSIHVSINEMSWIICALDNAKLFSQRLWKFRGSCSVSTALCALPVKSSMFHIFRNRTCWLKSLM